MAMAMTMAMTHDPNSNSSQQLHQQHLDDGEPMTGRFSFHSKPHAGNAPELPDIAIWIRFVLGALYGIFLGIRNETRGITAALFGFNLIAFVPMFWLNAFLDADVDSYKSLKFAGVTNALCLSLLIWIAIFTMKNEEAELSLGKIISTATMMAPVAGGGDSIAPVSQIISDEF